MSTAYKSKKPSTAATPKAGKGMQAELDKMRAELSINRAMSDNSPINILLANRDLIITYVNPASVAKLKTVEKFLPCRGDEVLGKSIDIFHKNPELQRRLLASDRNLPHRTIITIGPDKAELLVSAVYDNDGHYIGPMVTWDVITEKLAMEEKNRDFANQIAAISAAQAVIEFKLDGTIVTANDNFLKAVGYSLEEIKGRHHSIFADPKFAASPEYANFWAKLNRGESDSGQYQRFGKGGKELWLQARYSSLVGEDGKPYKVVKYATEITEQVRLQRQQQEQEAREKEVQAEMRRKVDELLVVVNAAANGDLTRDSNVRGTDPIGELANGLRKMIGDLRDVITQVVEGAAQFTEGARVVSESAQTLAQGANTKRLGRGNERHDRRAHPQHRGREGKRRQCQHGGSGNQHPGR